jgi:hypothetical protein
MRTLTVIELTATALALTACGLLVTTAAGPAIRLYTEPSPPLTMPVSRPVV